MRNAEFKSVKTDFMGFLRLLRLRTSITSRYGNNGAGLESPRRDPKGSQERESKDDGAHKAMRYDPTFFMIIDEMQIGGFASVDPMRDAQSGNAFRCAMLCFGVVTRAMHNMKIRA